MRRGPKIGRCGLTVSESECNNEQAEGWNIEPGVEAREGEREQDIGCEHLEHLTDMVSYQGKESVSTKAHQED